MINLYIADIRVLSSEEIFREYYRKIDRVRQEKVQNYKNITDKKRSLLAGYLLQVGIRNKKSEGSGLQADARPLSLSYTYGENGKPYLKNIPNTYFSLSHSGDYVICAISDEEIGADIQEHRKVKEDIATRFFSEEDKILLNKEKNNNDLFYQMWAVKEAHMKLTGLGMRQGMDSTTIRFKAKSSDSDLFEKGTINSIKMENKQAKFVIYDKIERYSIGVCSYQENMDMTIDYVK